MLKRKLNGIDFHPVKKLKTRRIKQIIEFNPEYKTWLIEWEDRSRSWASYKDLKDYEEFEKEVLRIVMPRQEVSYIN